MTAASRANARISGAGGNNHIDCDPMIVDDNLWTVASNDLRPAYAMACATLPKTSCAISTAAVPNKSAH
eukprot:7993032-Alexandrium_andersonii.AAC.1